MSPPNPPPSFLDRLRRFDPTVLPILVAAAVLIGAVIWLLGRPLPQPAPAADAQAAQQIATLRTDLTRVEGLTGRVAALEGTAQRLAALEARPAPDLAPLREAAAAATARAEAADRRAAALEERVAALTRELQARPALDQNAFAQRGAVEGLAGRLDALQRELQGRPVLDPNAFAPRAAIEGLTGRLEALQRELGAADAQAVQRLAAAEAAIAARAQAAEATAGRLTAVEQGLAGRLAALEGTLNSRLGAVEQQAGRIAALEAAQARLAAVEGRSARLAAVEGVRGALEAGQPLGPVLGALPQPPAALSRYADTAPPTLAALRLSFEDAVRAARQASEPQAGGGVLDSAAARLSGLVTVRRGEEMLVGDAAAAEIERARRALEAGDVEGAVRVLNRLSPPAKQAMRGWLDQAEALVAARAALRQLSAG
jgi:hypothetical protein